MLSESIVWCRPSLPPFCVLAWYRIRAERRCGGLWCAALGWDAPEAPRGLAVWRLSFARSRRIPKGHELKIKKKLSSWAKSSAESLGFLKSVVVVPGRWRGFWSSTWIECARPEALCSLLEREECEDGKIWLVYITGLFYNHIYL